MNTELSRRLIEETEKLVQEILKKGVEAERKMKEEMKESIEAEIEMVREIKERMNARDREVFKSGSESTSEVAELDTKDELDNAIRMVKERIRKKLTGKIVDEIDRNMNKIERARKIMNRLVEEVEKEDKLERTEKENKLDGAIGIEEKNELFNSDRMNGIINSTVEDMNKKMDGLASDIEESRKLLYRFVEEIIEEIAEGVENDTLVEEIYNNLLHSEDIGGSGEEIDESQRENLKDEKDKLVLRILLFTLFLIINFYFMFSILNSTKEISSPVDNSE